jgi:hypothetical protein
VHFSAAVHPRSRAAGAARLLTPSHSRFTQQAEQQLAEKPRILHVAVGFRAATDVSNALLKECCIL